MLKHYDGEILTWKAVFENMAFALHPLQLQVLLYCKNTLEFLLVPQRARLSASIISLLFMPVQLER